MLLLCLIFLLKHIIVLNNRLLHNLSLHCILYLLVLNRLDPSILLLIYKLQHHIILLLLYILAVDNQDLFHILLFFLGRYFLADYQAMNCFFALLDFLYKRQLQITVLKELLFYSLSCLLFSFSFFSPFFIYLHFGYLLQATNCP